MNSKRVGLLFLASMLVGCAWTLPITAEDGRDAAPVPGISAATQTGQPPSAHAPATTTGADQPTIVPGPLLEERQALLDHIQQAGAHGIGIANYLNAFKALNDQIGAGATESQVKGRVDQLTASLRDQLQRAQVLKVQRPLPPTASQQQIDSGGPAGASHLGAGAHGAGSAGGGGKEAIIEKIREKLGGAELPGGGDIGKLLNSDKAKELLKKFGQ